MLKKDVLFAIDYLAPVEFGRKVLIINLKIWIMKEREKWIHVRFKGAFYAEGTYCHTLKEFIERRKCKRSDIAEWWRRDYP